MNFYRPFYESWDRETDALLDSILTGSDDKLVLSLDGSGPFSDTSSDSGCNLLSPSNYEIPCVSSPERPSSIDFIGYLSNDEDEQPLHAVDPISISSPIVEERISVTNTDEEDEEIDIKPIIPLSSISCLASSVFPNSSSSSNSSSSNNSSRSHTTISSSSLVSSPKKPVNTPLRTPVNGVSSTTTPLQAGGTTTILLPVIKSVRQTVNLNKNSTKRRRASLSSNDSGHDDSQGNNTTIVHGHSGGDSSSSSSSPPVAKQGKYLALELTAEEQRLCEREGIKLPSHYPLSREEEKNLKRIRRKIRNKESAQHSRRRKKEYVDSMEDRVRICTEENEELKSKIQLLETQNKTLASQLRRLHQIIVSGGGFNKQNQTSTALMVLLLSTALFLIPGFQNKTEAKTELELPSSVKVSSASSGSSEGHSRSLLQFAPSSIKTEYASEPEAPLSSTSSSGGVVVGRLGRNKMGGSAHFDHDYLSSQKVNNYIEDDAPPRGYGPSIYASSSSVGNAKQGIKPSLEDRRLNVNISHGAVRTVLLHVPKDIK
ncbi:uncharacterized protein [Lepeophtheirus salmonis]|uniref:uncharacterized protein isoform X3 n=1 Tax=Lepeophtheirus salmonis TaxID=72036 RepID=UPI001AE8D85C|nr:cyclic AMP-responsive element-binding protein 3-like protein 2 isoform X3 [Lepeophtheirus salmonis]